MPRTYDIGLKEAVSLTMQNVKALEPVRMAVHQVGGMVSAEDLTAGADCPSATASLRDGYAVLSSDIQDATPNRGIRLRLAGSLAAGDSDPKMLRPGEAIEVLTGAVIPSGADAVVSVEFTRLETDHVVCHRDAPAGCNLLIRGSDVAAEGAIARAGQVLTPALTGLLAAGGIDRVPVYPYPRVAVVATGDEVVAPGRPLRSGQLYASNLVTLHSWLRHFGMRGETAVVKDRPGEMRKTFETLISKNDALLTSGGAWKSSRDLTTKILADMGWKLIFHRVRIGPGKAVALGILEGKPVFCLPGGPPSNEMAFLQIALPGLFRMAGKTTPPFKIKKARLANEVTGDVTWTQFFQADLERRKGELWAVPIRVKSRLQSQARAGALISIPEGVECLAPGNLIDVQILF